MVVQSNLYGVVHTKIKREVVLLNSVGGCSWGRCAFCEYHYTFSHTTHEAVEFNKAVLSNVEGVYDTLQTMCSASFVELPMETWYDIRDVCIQKNIKNLHIEMHWLYKEQVSRIREFFSSAGVSCMFIFGVETFDFYMREVNWCKGYGHATPEDIARYADGVNILIGIKGQTLESITKDIDIARSHFKLVNVIAFETNDTLIRRDNSLINSFYNSELFNSISAIDTIEILDGMDRRAPDNLGYVGVGAHY